jgi:hypothetical protein
MTRCEMLLVVAPHARSAREEPLADLRLNNSPEPISAMLEKWRGTDFSGRDREDVHTGDVSL